MKVSYVDFVLSGISMALLWGASWATTFLLLSPVWKDSLGGYAEIVNVVFFVTFYGLLSGFFLRLLLVLRPIRHGEFGFEDFEFTYFKLLTMLHYFGERALFLLQVEPMRPVIATLFGAKVGSNVAMGGGIDSPFLVTIGDNCALGTRSLVAANLLSRGKIMLGPIAIGDGVTLGVGALVTPNSKLGANCTVSPYSVLMPGSEIPAGESWKGQPARKWQ